MIVSKTLIYHDAHQSYEGVIAFDEDIHQQRPAVLVAHTWMGITQFEIDKAIALARLGYVGFAIDMYGQGRRPGNAAQAGEMMHELTDNRALLKERINLALNVMKSEEMVDESKTGAIGFCFGGKCVLDLARSNADIKAVVSFHGILDSPIIPNPDTIDCGVLVLHGWDDPLATLTQLENFAREMTKRKADWNIHAYGHTGHAFTNPNANRPGEGMFFQEKTNNRAWQSMELFFEEHFQASKG